jgi:hypothetical protein
MNCYTSPLPTKPIEYKNYEYWIDGDVESKPPKYHYFVRGVSKKTFVTVASDQTFDTVVAANGAARVAIDSYAAVATSETPIEPTPSKQRATRSKK